MENVRKRKCFQLVRDKLSASRMAFIALLFSLLIPSHPLNGERGHWIEQVKHPLAKGDSELLMVYSIVKSQRADLRDGWAWDISTTILEESRRHSLDPLLVLALINVESSFQTEAVSTEGARGLMQIRPIAANAVINELVSMDKGVNGAIENSLDLSILHPLDLDDPVLNIKLGVFYLNSLKKNFRDLKLALTAYNWGPTKVRNRLQEDEVLPLAYAMKVLSTYQSYRQDSPQTHKTP
jgi:soluble lytic murein transglycosylase